jgi:hypothetical protein
MHSHSAIFAFICTLIVHFLILPLKSIQLLSGHIDDKLKTIPYKKQKGED